MSRPVDQGSLPPTQYLMLEVLAARYRLGENLWTFPQAQSAIARQLEKAGLVSWKGGIAQGTILVWLTEAGLDTCLSTTYVAPIDR